MKRAAVLAATLLVSTPLVASDLWLHLRLEEHNGSRNRVVVNLPVRALEKALPLIPAGLSHSCEVRLNDSEITPAELRSIVRQLRPAPSGTAVRISRDGDEILVRKAGLMLVISAAKDGDMESNRTVSVPFDLAEALLGGDDDLDFRAAVDLLVRRGEGEIMMVDQHDQTVRIWVDQTAAAPIGQNLVSATRK